MCQNRADILCSVKETARKIICPTESDEMCVKCVVKFITSAPSAKCLIENVTHPKVRERVHRQRLGWSTNDVQKNRSDGVMQWGDATLTAWSRKQQTVILSFDETELYALTTGFAERIVTNIS